MNWLLLIVGVIGVLVAIRLIVGARAGLPLPSAMAEVKAGTAVLVDVREAAEWRDGVAAGAARLSLSDLRGARLAWNPFLTEHRGKKLLLYCASGTRSGLAAAALRREGFDAVNVGSFSAWAGAGWPVQRS